MIIVTGGAGCIGSAVIWALNKRGITDIILVDGVDHPEKEKNIAFIVPLFNQQVGDIFKKIVKEKALSAVVHYQQNPKIIKN